MSKYLEKIANNSTQSERTSWKRRITNMEALLEKIKPYEEQILELIAQKQSVMDEIAALRKEMVDICVHPIEYLVLADDTPETHAVVECKFCNKQLTVAK